MSKAITVQGIYAVAIVRDFDAAISWYTAFMGRSPDDMPFPGMAQWRNMGAAGLQVWQDDTRAGHAIMTVVVPDLASEKRRLANIDLFVGNEASGEFGAVAQLFDPEGNQINLSEPPKGFKNG